MTGYDADFLGTPLPLPNFSAALIGDVLRRDDLAPNDDGLAVLAHYPHYTVATDRRRRVPLFAALNVDQPSLRSVSRTDNWRIDSRIGAEFQLNNDYYFDNPWDRGHLARRATAAWGSGREAKLASDETFYFSNSSLQHKNFNQDEWVALEDWAKDLKIDKTNKVTVFSGPIFGEFVRAITPPGRETALVPSAFFKVVAFIGMDDKLAVRAFVMVQDEEAMRDRKGAERIRQSHGSRDMFEFQRYQVSVTEIEERTGLIFPQEIPDGNPLFFSGSRATAEAHNISHFPERIEVDGAHEMINAEDDARIAVMDDDVPVFIAAALVNPDRSDQGNEWVSIVNLSAGEIDLAGWTLSDTIRPPFKLSGKMPPGEALRAGPSVKPLMLANTGGVIVLRNADGNRIDRVRYTKKQGRIQGKTVIFARHMPEMTR